MPAGVARIASISGDEIDWLAAFGALKAATDLRKTTPDQTAIKEAEQRGYERGKAEGHLDGMTEIVRLIRPAVEKGNALIAAGAELAAALREIAPALTAPSPAVAPIKQTPAPTTRIPAQPRRKPGLTPAPNGDDRLPDLLPAHRRILNALAEFEALGFPSVSRAQLGFWVGLRANTGNFGNYLGVLRSAGLIEYPDAGMVALTDQGRAAATPVEGPPDTTELQRRVREKLSPALWRILETVIAVYPGVLTREEIGDAVGLKANTGNFGNYLGSLRTLGLIDYPAPGQVTAQPVLFIDG